MALNQLLLLAATVAALAAPAAPTALAAATGSVCVSGSGSAWSLEKQVARLAKFSHVPGLPLAGCLKSERDTNVHTHCAWQL